MTPLKAPLYSCVCFSLYNLPTIDLLLLPSNIHTQTRLTSWDIRKYGYDLARSAGVTPAMALDHKDEGCEVIVGLIDEALRLADHCNHMSHRVHVIGGNQMRMHLAIHPLAMISEKDKSYAQKNRSIWLHGVPVRACGLEGTVEVSDGQDLWLAVERLAGENVIERMEVVCDPNRDMGLLASVCIRLRSFEDLMRALSVLACADSAPVEKSGMVYYTLVVCPTSSSGEVRMLPLRVELDRDGFLRSHRRKERAEKRRVLADQLQQWEVEAEAARKEAQKSLSVESDGIDGEEVRRYAGDVLKKAGVNPHHLNEVRKARRELALAVNSLREAEESLAALRNRREVERVRIEQDKAISKAEGFIQEQKAMEQYLHAMDGDGVVSSAVNVAVKKSVGIWASMERVRARNGDVVSCATMVITECQKVRPFLESCLLLVRTMEVLEKQLERYSEHVGNLGGSAEVIYNYMVKLKEWVRGRLVQYISPLSEGSSIYLPMGLATSQCEELSYACSVLESVGEGLVMHLLGTQRTMEHVRVLLRTGWGAQNATLLRSALDSTEYRLSRLCALSAELLNPTRLSKQDIGDMDKERAFLVACRVSCKELDAAVCAVECQLMCVEEKLATNLRTWEKRLETGREQMELEDLRSRMIERARRLSENRTSLMVERARLRAKGRRRKSRWGIKKTSYMPVSLPGLEKGVVVAEDGVLVRLPPWRGSDDCEEEVEERHCSDSSHLRSQLAQRPPIQHEHTELESILTNVSDGVRKAGLLREILLRKKLLGKRKGLHC